jgi:hypothetical protein
MSFNRVTYDKSAYDLQMQRSVGQGDYRLFAPFAENIDQCLSMDGPVGSKADVSTVKKPNSLSFKEMTDVESALSWRSQRLTKSNDNINLEGKFDIYHKESCTKKLVSQDTRFTHPLDNYRSMSLTPLMIQPYLPVNPQCNQISNNDLIGLNSRLSAKDCYNIPDVVVWDNGDALPIDNGEPINNEVYYKACPAVTNLTQK